MRNQSQRSGGSSVEERRNTTGDNKASGHKRSLRLPHIQYLRKMLDELEIKLDARSCLEHNGRQRYARRIPVEKNAAEILQSLQDLIDSFLPEPVAPIAATIGNHDRRSQSSAQRDHSTVRIQLKLSPALVRVLQTVRKERVRASELVESVLWSSPRVQDTARLAGIAQPGQAPAA